MHLKGKVAVVTGGSRGIGRGIALRLARDGALVAVHYGSNAEAAAVTVRDIETAGGVAFAVRADTGDVAQIRQFYKTLDTELTDRTGDVRFDVLVNNAGVGVYAPVEGTTEETYDRTMAVNLKGPFFVTQQALPRLRDGGRIINVSAGLSRHPSADLAAYSMAKAGINAFTILLAARLGERGITVNAVGPGAVNTDTSRPFAGEPEQLQRIVGLTALGRIGEVGDIAGVAAFLASPDSGWVTGQYIEASGGFNI